MEQMLLSHEKNKALTLAMTCMNAEKMTLMREARPHKLSTDPTERHQEKVTPALCLPWPIPVEVTPVQGFVRTQGSHTFGEAYGAEVTHSL